MKVPVFPSNFVSNWAARDADAAYAWFAKNENVTYEKFGSLLEGVEKQGVPGASYTWAADKLEEPGTARDAVIRGLAQFDWERKTTTINSIAQAMPDDASRLPLGDIPDCAELRRYGFHGLSCESIVHQLGVELPQRLPAALKKHGLGP